MTRKERKIIKIRNHYEITAVRRVGRCDSKTFAVVVNGSPWKRPTCVLPQDVLGGGTPSVGRLLLPCNLVCNHTGKYCIHGLKPDRIYVCKSQFFYVCDPADFDGTPRLVSSFVSNPDRWRIESVLQPKNAPETRHVFIHGRQNPYKVKHKDCIGRGAPTPGGYMIPCRYVCPGNHGPCLRRRDVNCRGQFLWVYAKSALSR